MSECRLCSSDRNVVDVFHSDLKNADKLRHCIYLATKIEIKKGDLVSTMVCHRCCELTVNLYKYRMHAIKNDRLLKQKCKLPLQSSILLSDDDDDVVVVQLELPSLKAQTNNSDDNLNNNTNRYESNVSDNKTTRRVIKQHPSVQRLLNENKTLVLPVEAYGDDVSPSVTLDTAELDEWYLTHRRDSEEYNEPEQPLSFIPSGNASETDSDSDRDWLVRNVKLRKRRKRRIIIDSDSEDEPPRPIPKKIPKTTHISPEIADVQTLENTVMHVPSESHNKPVETSQRLPDLNAAASIEENLQLLFSEFNKYGINVETKDVPIETRDKDALINDKEEISNAHSSDENSEVKLLFKEHYDINYKPKISVMYNKREKMILFRNMLYTLNKHCVPVDVMHSNAFGVSFVRNLTNIPNTFKENGLWLPQDCTDIRAVIRQTNTQVDNTISAQLPKNPTNWGSSNAPVAIVTYSTPEKSVMQPIMLNATTQSHNPKTPEPVMNVPVLNGNQLASAKSSGSQRAGNGDIAPVSGRAASSETSTSQTIMRNVTPPSNNPRPQVTLSPNTMKLLTELVGSTIDNLGNCSGDVDSRILSTPTMRNISPPSNHSVSQAVVPSVTTNVYTVPVKNQNPTVVNHSSGNSNRISTLRAGNIENWRGNTTLVGSRIYRTSGNSTTQPTMRNSTPPSSNPVSKQAVVQSTHTNMYSMPLMKENQTAKLSSHNTNMTGTQRTGTGANCGDTSSIRLLKELGNSVMQPIMCNTTPSSKKPVTPTQRPSTNVYNSPTALNQNQTKITSYTTNNNGTQRATTVGNWGGVNTSSGSHMSINSMQSTMRNITPPSNNPVTQGVVQSANTNVNRLPVTQGVVQSANTNVNRVPVTQGVVQPANTNVNRVPVTQGVVQSANTNANRVPVIKEPHTASYTFDATSKAQKNAGWIGDFSLIANSAYGSSAMHPTIRNTTPPSSNSTTPVVQSTANQNQTVTHSSGIHNKTCAQTVGNVTNWNGANSPVTGNTWGNSVQTNTYNFPVTNVNQTKNYVPSCSNVLDTDMPPLLPISSLLIKTDSTQHLPKHTFQNTNTNSDNVSNSWYLEPSAGFSQTCAQLPTQTSKQESLPNQYIYPVSTSQVQQSHTSSSRVGAIRVRNLSELVS